jgi:hypothetical protein
MDPKSLKEDLNPNINSSSQNRASMQKVEAVLDRWLCLQKVIKEEITLNEISNYTLFYSK